MENPQSERRWEEGLVKKFEEHILIRYGDIKDQHWKSVARLTKQTESVFIVEWLIDRDLPENQVMVNETIEDLNFYMVEHECRGFTPWHYAIYHTSTASNLYSDVHWSYFPND